MWMMTVAGGFVSLVEDRDDKTRLQVRARVPEDITATFADAEVFVIDGADYRYRARVARQEAADALAKAVVDINYDSHFKDVALQRSPAHPGRMKAYYGCWTALAELQDYAPYSRVPRGVWEDELEEEPWR